MHQYLEDQCTQSPTIAPSSNPSFTPSAKPTEFPTITPTVKPTLEPTTNSPSLEPTSLPTFAPTLQPTTEPTNSPSVEPTLEQSLLFSTIPSESPTNPPTLPPSESPSLSSSPTEEPRIFPTLTPTGDPTEELSVYPTLLPSDTPTITVSLYPTVEITAAPTEENTEEITTAIPTTFLPTILPTPLPTFIPTLSTLSPTLEATEAPSEDPTEAPFVVNAQVMHSKNTLNDDHASELYYLPKVPLFVPKNQEIKNRKLSESYRCSYGFPTEGRAYPDVAVLGSNFQFIMNNVTGRISSTQAVAVFASMVSLVNARRLSLGKPSLGWINPSLYKYQSLFAKDIIQGDNRCTRSTCCSQGFSAGRGWDPMTGIGSLNFSRFSDVFTNTENITTSTFAPTAAPTPSPTARPTPTPSAAPSNRPPSASPTRQFLPVLQFNSIIKIQGLLSLNISAATKLTILQAQAQSLGIDVRYLEFVGFANSTEEALKRMTLEMELLAFDIVVITRFILPLVDFPAMDGNVTKLFSTIKNTLQIAMNNGNLLRTMQEIAVTYNSTELSAVSLSEIAFTQAFIMQPPTHFPTLVPITRPSAPINDGAIAGIVIGVLLIVFATSYAIYRYILYRQGQQSNGKIQVRIHRDYQLAVMKEMVRDPNQIHVEVGNRMLHTSKEVTKRGSAFLVDEVYATPEGKPPSSDIRFSNSKFRDQRAKFKPYDPEMQQLQPVSLTEYTVQY